MKNNRCLQCIALQAPKSQKHWGVRRELNQYCKVYMQVHRMYSMCINTKSKHQSCREKKREGSDSQGLILREKKNWKHEAHEHPVGWPNDSLMTRLSTLLIHTQAHTHTGHTPNSLFATVCTWCICTGMSFTLLHFSVFAVPWITNYMAQQHMAF